MNYCSDMRTRTPMRVLLTIALTLALLPMLSTFAPGGQVGGFTTASPAVADQVWYQSVGRVSATAACEKSTTTELAQGWTDWAPSWDTWVNSGNGGFVCNRHITWAYDTPPVSCAAGAGAAGTCVVGNIGPGGGIVFYVDDSNATGSRYLEAATADLTAIAWCSNTSSAIAGVETFTTAGSAPAIGGGNANTNAMLAGSPAACTSGAAVSARAYGTATAPAGSWFLPNLAELNQLYVQRTVVGGFAAVNYWSSSQLDAGDAWYQYFGSGGQSYAGKGNALGVRPVRAF
jgi:hypothetical protein